jgi:hypothetical protein
MKILNAACLAISLCVPSAALAGAWLKEKGHGFVSLSFGANMAEEITGGLYVEYGLSDSTTIGIDISGFSGGSITLNGYGSLFLRRSIGPTDKPSKWAYEIGIGGYWEQETARPALKSAISWGRGFQFKGRNGWMNMDGAFIYDPTLGSHMTKLDATVGMEIGKITTGILELALGHKDDNTFGSIEPSLLLRPKNMDFQFKLGANIPFEDQDKSALKLGIWRSF